MLFNVDMDQRLVDLHGALSAGGVLTVRHHAAYDHPDNGQPERLWVDIVGTERRLVFDIPTASGLADQLSANGFGDAAGLIRKAITA